MFTVVVYGKKCVCWWGKENGKWNYVADPWFAISMGRKVKNNYLKLRRLLGSPFLLYLFVVMNSIYVFSHLSLRTLGSQSLGFPST